MKPTDLATYLSQFLTVYLPAQRNLSPHTIRSYRDTFMLFFRFCRDDRSLVPERLQLQHIEPALVLAFLEYLETQRQASIRTRNQRLAALHSFFRYLQTEAPDHLLRCQRILAIPRRRFATAPVSYLSADELAVIFRQPDLTTTNGRRDAVLLSVLYDTAARIQELIDLSGRDVRLTAPAQIQLTGKGRKTRVIPLMVNTARLLERYLQERRLDRPEQWDKPLFQNRCHSRLSRSGVRYILDKYTAQARRSDPNLQAKITPHSLRHSKAMHLLQSGTPLVIIRDILGHADISTTGIYARADIEMKQHALAKASDKTPPLELPSWQNNKDLMQWLRTL